MLKKDIGWKKLRLCFKLALSCIFVAYITINIDALIFIQALKSIDVTLYFVSALMLALANIILAYIYFLLIKDTIIKQTFLSLIRINFIVFYYSLFLPTNLSVDAVRWYKVTRNKDGRFLFLGTTIYARSILFFIVLASAFIPSFFYAPNPEIVGLQKEILYILLSLLIFTAFVISCFLFPVLRSFIISSFRKSLPQRWKRQDISLLLSDSTSKNITFTSFPFVLFITILMHFCLLGRVLFLAHSLYLPFNFIDIIWMGSLVLLAQIIPISHLGIGVREGIYSFLFTLFNLPAEKGVVLGVLLFSQLLLFSIFGWILDWTEK